MERQKKLLYEKRAEAQAEQRYKELDARQQQKALTDHLQQQEAAFRLQQQTIATQLQQQRAFRVIEKQQQPNQQQPDQAGVNSINILCMHFRTNVFFMYMLLEKAAEMRRLYEKFCTFNVDEIDYRARSAARSAARAANAAG
jgi:hypothetical protein